jgi:3-hydroxyisobutyrate dehydrogenase-like beta-hydroxyacid dehydrogenase
MNKQVSILGAGLLGGAIIERLSEQGWSLRVYDPSELPRKKLGHLEVQWMRSETEALEGAKQAIFCLPNSGVTARLAPEIFPAMALEGLAVDCTTGDPEEMAQLGALASRSGLHYLDATIGGSSVQTKAGEVLIMVGGGETALEAGKSLLQSLSRSVVHVGPHGYGARMKLVMNLVLGLNRAVLAEALSLGRALELEPEMVLQVLREGPAYSRVMDTKGRKMLDGNYAAEARLSQHRKDVGLMLDAARRLGIELPLTQTHDSLLQAAEAAGFGANDNSAVIEAYRRS